MGSKQTPDALMRQKMIHEELTAILKEVEEQELDEEMEKESVDALKVAANNICYLKRYYDPINDKLIVFPSVAKTIVDYSLMDEAEKHYWEEEDEFPIEYSAALRSIATENYEEEQGDDVGHDDDMMDRLSMNLVLTQEEEDELKKAMEETEAEEEDAEEQAEPEAEAEAEKENEAPHVLLLVSKTTIGNREQLANQDLVVTMLESQGIEPVLLDGADPSNKDRRNELFGISGIRAKYPQLFVTAGDNTKFIGDFDTIQMYNETGQLTKSHLLSDEKETEEVEPAPEETVEPVADAPPAPFKPHLLLLISKLSTIPEQTRNQDMVLTLIKTNNLDDPEILDGADLMNKDRRNELFGISGLRAKYPQLFVVTNADEAPTFVGDFDTIQGLNECGQLTKSHLLGIQDEAAAAATEPPAKTEPALVEENKAEVQNKENVAPLSNTREMPQQPKKEPTGPQLLLLISNISGNRQQDANQELVMNTLKSERFNPIFLDGSDPQNKTRRNELFEISGIRAKYPQLFLVKDDKKKTTQFIGDFEKIQEMNKAGDLTEAKLFGKRKFLDQKKLLMIGAGLAVTAAVFVAFVMQRNAKEESFMESIVLGSDNLAESIHVGES
jgi:hypothetical protein